ncbi:MAG: guanine deaminase [Chthoniobacterales bacterium]|nr:guanine deaminase [Chthoniobacterales bacterium]
MERHLFGIRGFAIDTPEFGALRGRRDAAIVVENGRIVAVGNFAEVRRSPRAAGVRWLEHGNVAIFPGLIDCHTHLPQYAVVARGQSGLLPWLRENIFPVEREFTGPKARVEAPQFFQQLARHGTTTAMVYAAIYEDSCNVGFEAARDSGLRIILGKMMMDLGSYGQLQPKKILSVSLLESERLCRRWHGADEGRLEYAFSPRFAVTCSEKLMRSAAELAGQCGAYLQTHLAENREEIEKVHNLYMPARDYTDVYEKAGLLTPKTVLGHCIHLSDREINAIAASKSAIAHCPTSNLFLGSGLMKLDRCRAAGIAIGLGSDVAAGPELNMWQVMRAAVDVQTARTFHDPTVPALRLSEAFYLATTGGAEALGKRAAIGTLDVGKEADLTLVNVDALLPYSDPREHLTGLSKEDVLALCVYRGGPHATAETFVRGRSVYRAASQPKT